MHIELLWLVPVMALAVFLFFIAFSAQRRTDTRIKTRSLSQEVELFNAGYGQQKPVAVKSADDRLREMEKMINAVADAVALGQGAGSGFHKETDVPGDDSGALRNKLRGVFREYDIILSENYTLRTKVKQLTKKIQEMEAAADDVSAVGSVLTSNPASAKSVLRLYDDTRLINLAALESGEDLASGESTAG